MSSDDHDQLSPAARRLLELEKERPAADEAAQQRVLERLSATLGFTPPAAGGGAHGPSASTAAQPAGPTAAPVVKSGVLKALLGSKLALGIAIATGGALVAGGLYLQRSTLKNSTLKNSTLKNSTLKKIDLKNSTESARLAQASTPVSPPVLPPEAAPIPPSAAQQQPATVPAASLAPLRPAPTPPAASQRPQKIERAAVAREPKAAPPPEEPDTLAAENALLERARAAMMGKRADEALRLLDQHRREHPTGRLREERDALRIQVLVQLGHADEARAAAAAFRASYAESLLQPVVDAAIDSLR